MRILLIAYEWPPIVAAQSIRWKNIAEGLAKLGVSVEVLCPSITEPQSKNQALIPNIIEHRVWPGPFIGFSQWLANRQVKLNLKSNLGTKNATTPPLKNFKSLLLPTYKILRKFLDHIIFPDVRSEWYFFARHKLNTLLQNNRYDAIISSHEPGVDLLLGLYAVRKAGSIWIVDLADPLCTPYSPKWRKKIDSLFEGLILKKADKIILTTDSLIDVFNCRHKDFNESKVVIIPQGATFENFSLQKSNLGRPNKLIVSFTGNFYKTFRNPINFAKALKYFKTINLEIIIVGDNDHFFSMFEHHTNCHFLGKVSHVEAMHIQSEADVLLSIGNTQSDQLPGKIFEYISVGKPILHIMGSDADPTKKILDDYPLGYICSNNIEAIRLCLDKIISDYNLKRINLKSNDYQNLKNKYSWDARALEVHSLLKTITNTPS